MRSGHFVQIWRPVWLSRFDVKWVEVEGRTWGDSISPELWNKGNGWVTVSRELDLRRAKRFAKAYARAGFPSRVVFKGNDGNRKIVLEIAGK